MENKSLGSLNNRNMRTLISWVACAFVACIFLAACSTVPTAGPNEARVSGRKARAPLTFCSVLIAPADHSETNRDYQNVIVIPEGKSRLALIYSAEGRSGLGVVPTMMQFGAERRHVKIVEFDAKAGHEYYVDVSAPMISGVVDHDYRVLDKTTGEVVVNTKK